MASQPYINITEAWSECGEMGGKLAQFAKYDDFVHFIRGMDSLKDNQTAMTMTRLGNPNYCEVNNLERRSLSRTTGVVEFVR